MAITQNVYTGNGSTVLYSFTFPYLNTSDIVVEVNDAPTTAYTFANATTIQFNTAPANGARVRIYRVTDTDNPEAVFYPGSSIRAKDLNDALTQTLYSVQEWRGQTVPLYNAVIPDDLNMGGNQINNMAEPTSDHDAATKNYVDTTTWNNTTETTQSTETWTSVDTQIPTNKSVDQRIDAKIDTALTSDIAGSDGVTITDDGDGTITVGLNTGSVDLDRIKPDDIITTSEQDIGSPSWVNEDTKITTAGAAAKRFDTIVQTLTPSGSDWQVGKTWLQNDVNNTLSIWDGTTWKGVASGGTFTTQPTVIYVDAINGNDANDGHRIINPKKTIKNAVASAAAGDIIKVAPGVYQEALPIDITVANLSIVGDAQRSCFVHPTPATETQTMFRCNSGTYIDGFTFAGLKASGARGGHPVDNDPTYGLPANQGSVAGFYPGCIVRKSPFINNCTNFADSGIDNSSFDPNNYTGTGGDTTSAPTGGGIFVDGSLPSVSSPLRSFVINEFTQVNLDGPGLLVANNGYAQAVSFFGLFCHYHAKALSGGQINMEVGTTDFGRYGLIADGKSSTAIFTATANGNASAGAITFNINAPTAAPSWFGDATRPAINMLVQIGSNIYPILSSGPNGSGWSVTISRPNPANRAENLGLINGHSNGATVSFFLRSMISTASHTFEYAGSGTDYNALPENGGVPVEANEAVSRNNGKVWLTSTDQSGKFKVGDTFVVDQQTGFVNIDPNSYGVNIVSDLSPQLGGDLDVFGRSIFNSSGNVFINDVLETISGSAAAPSITFNGDPNTGIYSPSADQLSLSTGGVERFRIDSSGRVGIGTSSPGYLIHLGGSTAAAVNGQIALGNIGSTPSARIDGFRPDGTFSGQLHLYTTTSVGTQTRALTIDQQQRVGIGTSSPTRNFVLNGTGVTYLKIAESSLGEAIGDGFDLMLDSSATAYVWNRENGAIAFGSNNLERVRITSTGQVRLAGAGITFNGDTATANELDDYEEGTWTVTFHDAVSGGNQSATTTTGTYTKVGRFVHLQFVVNNINTTGLTAGNQLFFSLPFTGLSSPFEEYNGACIFYGTSLATTPAATHLVGNSARAYFLGNSTGATFTTFTISSITSGANGIRASLSYMA